LAGENLNEARKQGDPSFHRSVQHLTVRASVYRDNTANIATVNVFVVQRDRWYSLALHVGVIT